MGLLFKTGTGSHVRAQTDDGFDSLFHGLRIKLDGPKEIAVISHGERRKAKLLGTGHELIDLAGGIEKTEFGVTVKMDEVAVAHGLRVSQGTVNGERK